MSREKLERAKVKNGPCESSIEPVLQKHNIQRQAIMEVHLSAIKYIER